MSAQPDTQECVSFSIAGVPPNWSNVRLHFREKAKQLAMWREMTHYTAASARIMHGRNGGGDMAIIPSKQFNGKRMVEITLFKRRLFDADGAYSAAKPILDGIQGQLIVDDSPQWIELKVTQVKVQSPLSERTQIIVWREQ